MSRPDLASAGMYGGWQAIDATPQESSGGMSQPILVINTYS